MKVWLPLLLAASLAAQAAKKSATENTPGTALGTTPTLGPSPGLAPPLTREQQRERDYERQRAESAARLEAARMRRLVEQETARLKAAEIMEERRVLREMEAKKREALRQEAEIARKVQGLAAPSAPAPAAVAPAEDAAVAVGRLAAQRANLPNENAGEDLRRINETLDSLFALRARCLARQAALEEAMTEDRARRDRAAGRAMLSASREDQLRAALLAKFVRENGPISARQLQYMDEGTRSAARLVPGALPPEIDEFAAAIAANRRKLAETNSAILEMERKRVEMAAVK